MAYYFDDADNLKPEWVTDEAEKAAQSFYEINPRGSVIPSRSLNNAQLRKFYGDFKSLEAEIGQAGDTAEDRFAAVLPRIKMAAAKVTYAKARGVVPASFVRWMKNHVSQVNNLAEFRAFLLHFEAVVGYCYGIHKND